MMGTKIDENTVKRQFGANLRRLRKQKGFSQEELALEADLDLTSINEIEMGRRNPTLKTIYRIAHALGLKTKDIFSL